ncbi:hypothetical protein F4778DRAFT_749690 [Xylariomycetidae sp. FL2044]|nr:hypothetical protein F4778DRAFT_749690 [Xylariomycetidae sp. FL2044]
MAPATLYIAYPKGANVDMDYYMNKHMAAARKAFPEDATHYKVTKTLGDDAPYEVVTAIEFSSTEALMKMVQNPDAGAMKAAQDDVKNFSKLAPVRWIAEEVAAGPVRE